MKLWTSIICVIALSGCAASAPTVRGNVSPMPGGNYRVESTSAEAQDATKKALESAQAVCSGKRHIVTNQKTEYKGQYGTEAARDIIDEKNKTIAALKKQTYYYPYYERRNDYVATIEFRCES